MSDPNQRGPESKKKTRAFDAPTLSEEKRQILEEARKLRAKQSTGASVWCAQQELFNEMKAASDDVKNDRATMEPLVELAGEFLRYCGPGLRADFELALKAAESDQWALEVANEALLGNREFMLKVVKHDGRSLRHASYPLRSDKDMVMAAVGSSARALEYASAELKSDLDVITRALQRQKSEGERFNVLRFANPEIRGDKDLVLLALRCTTSDKVAHEGWTKASEQLQTTYPWKEYAKISKMPLAVRGDENAPVMTIKLRPTMDPHEPGVCISFGCEVTWISGTTFWVDIPEGACSVVGRTKRLAPTVLELAKLLVSKISRAKAMEGVERIFIVFQTERRGSVQVSVWDWKRALNEFV